MIKPAPWRPVRPHDVSSYWGIAILNLIIWAGVSLVFIVAGLLGFAGDDLDRYVGVPIAVLLIPLFLLPAWGASIGIRLAFRLASRDAGYFVLLGPAMVAFFYVVIVPVCFGAARG